ncbi:MAG: PqqD family protein [Clostridia bacterium]|nr:PqqD family protein [Clostridia bacterium]
MKFHADPNLILREIAGEALLIPVGETALRIHGMISLTESGLMLWKQLQTPCTEDDLIRCILHEYDTDSKTAAADVRTFIDKMNTLGILLQDENEETE